MPPEPLPADWTGTEAGELYHEINERLERPATAYVRRVAAH